MQITCETCMYYIGDDLVKGKCHANPPLATLVPSQGIGGQGLALITYSPEVSRDRAACAMYKSRTIKIC